MHQHLDCSSSLSFLCVIFVCLCWTRKHTQRNRNLIYAITRVGWWHYLQHTYNRDKSIVVKPIILDQAVQLQQLLLLPLYRDRIQSSDTGIIILIVVFYFRLSKCWIICVYPSYCLFILMSLRLSCSVFFSAWQACTSLIC